MNVVNLKLENCRFRVATRGSFPCSFGQNVGQTIGSATMSNI